MIHFLLLTVYTLVIGFLGWKVWRKTREMSFLLGIALIYYWTLLGAWFFTLDDLYLHNGADWGLHFYIFFKMLFPVHADTYYLLGNAIYAGFIIAVELVVLYTTKPVVQQRQFKPVRINHILLIAICVITAIISFFLVWKQILTAAKYHESIYIVTRMAGGRFFTIHQLLNQICVVSLYIGLISYISGEGRYITGNRSNRIFIGYIFAVFFVEGYLLLLGNKREMFFGGILGAIFYLQNTNYRIRWKSLASFVVVVLIPLFFNDGLRGYSPVWLTKYFDTSGLEFHRKKEFTYTEFSMKNTTFVFLFSNEMFYGHFAMYGILEKHVPVTYGSSLVSLGASIIPRALWPNRPAPIYDYYATQVKAEEGQGYTINHAAAWYLNFGTIGVLLGAFALAWLWVWLYNRHLRIDETKNVFMKLIFIIGLAAFTAQLPGMMRNGPETYKSLVFESILFPVAVIYLATKFQRQEAQKETK